MASRDLSGEILGRIGSVKGGEVGGGRRLEKKGTLFSCSKSINGAKALGDEAKVKRSLGGGGGRSRKGIHPKPDFR